MNLFYRCLYDVSLLALLPKILCQRVFFGKYRGNLLKRLGIGFPKVDKGDRSLVWVHAVSLGEVKAMVPLIYRLKEELNDPVFIVSSVTETGLAEVKRALPFARAHVFLPFDLSWVIRPILRRLSPDLLILCETDFWQNLVYGAKQVGAKVVLVNGKLSERSQSRFQRFSALVRSFWRQFDLYCVQSEIYRKRFEKVGVEPQRLIVTGNLKFDQQLKRLSCQQVIKWREILGFNPETQVLTIASTHDPEERLLIEVLKGIWKSYPKLNVLLAPRHPHRFDAVAKMFESAGERIGRCSQSEKLKGEKLILVDAMGMLGHCYQISDLAIVCGSFTDRVGGHNILEPCAFGTPVLFGPHMYAQPDLVTLVHRYGAGKQLALKEIASEILSLFSHRQQLDEMRKASLAMMASVQGATTCTLHSIKNSGLLPL